MAVAQVVILNNGITSQEIKRGEINRATAKTGEHYRVLEKTVDKDQLLDDVLAKKEGQDLHLVYSDGTEVILEDYYTVCADGACDVTLPGETASGYQISTNDVTGIAVSEESSLVYAHGQRDTLISMTQDTPMQATLSALEGAQITYLPEEATGLSMGAWGGLALLGGLGIAAASDGSSGSSDAAPTVNNTVTGTIVGGPVLEGNDLKVIAYQADGVTVLGEGTVDTTGKFTIDVGSYTGVVIAKVINQGSGADYLDEATGVGKDLNAEIYSTGVVTSANSTLTLNLNAVTTIAYHKALESTAGAPLDETTVNSTNTAIAQAFGLSDLHTTDIITTNGTTTSFDSSDGLNAGETYGTILAALSGADTNNAGDSQATIDNLVAGITIAGETATLTAAVQDEVIQGAGIVSANSGGETSVIVDTIAPAITSTATATAIDENSGASQVIYTATATDSSTITYTLKTGSDAGLTINGTTGEVTLTADPDFETTPSYSFTVVATDSANNASEQAVSLAINNLDDTAPNITSFDTISADDLISTNEETAGFNLTGTGEVGATVTVTGATFAAGNTALVDGSGNWTMAVATGELTANAANALSATQTDVAGNVSAAGTTTITTDLVAAAPAFGTISTDDLINASEETAGFNLTGTGEVGATVTVTGATFDAGNTALVDGSGNWTMAVATGELTANAANALSATQTDVAGNVSAAGTTTITTDLVAAAPAFDTISADDLISTNEETAGFNLTGTGEVGATVTVTGATFAAGNTAVVDGSGNWTMAVVAGELTTNAANALSATQTDVAGNVSAAGATTITTDTTAPTFQSAASSVDGTKVILTYDEALNATTAAVGDFAVTIGGNPNIVTAVAVNGSTVELTLTTTVANGNVVTVAYTDPTGGDDASAIQDAAGNDAITIVAQTVTNNVPDTTAPAAHATTPISADETGGTTANTYDAGDKITITFDEAVSTTDLLIGNLAVSNSHILGTGATITAVTPSNGFATSFDIVLGDGTTVAPDDVITATAANVVDAVGNAPSVDVGFTAPALSNTSIVVFDLVNGVSSDHSSRTFDATLVYTIFVVVNATSHLLNDEPLTDATWAKWKGAENLGVDDTVVLASGDGAAVKGYGGGTVNNLGIRRSSELQWGQDNLSFAAGLKQDGYLRRAVDMAQHKVDLWDGLAGYGTSGDPMQHVYNPAGLAGVLTTQGLT
jgi:uncharacterized repeat protein (TIGR02059 family)